MVILLIYNPSIFIDFFFQISSKREPELCKILSFFSFFLLFFQKIYSLYHCYTYLLTCVQDKTKNKDKQLKKKPSLWHIHVVSNEIYYFITIELPEEKRSQCDQKKRYKDTLKASLNDFDIPMGSWEQTAQERSKLRVSSAKKQLSMKDRESVKLKESAENAKPIPMGHQLIILLLVRDERPLRQMR